MHSFAVLAREVEFKSTTFAFVTIFFQGKTWKLHSGQLTMEKNICNKFHITVPKSKNALRIFLQDIEIPAGMVPTLPSSALKETSLSSLFSCITRSPSPCMSIAAKFAFFTLLCSKFSHPVKKP